MALFHGHYIDGGFAMPFYKVRNEIMDNFDIPIMCIVSKC